MTRTRIAFESNTLGGVGEIAAEFVRFLESKRLRPCVSEVSGPVRGRSARLNPFGTHSMIGDRPRRVPPMAAALTNLSAILN